jgi:hypothetical protein
MWSEEHWEIVEKYLASARKNGVNVLSKLRQGSTWLQLDVGSNVFLIDADKGASEMYFTLIFKQAYV